MKQRVLIETKYKAKVRSDLVINFNQVENNINEKKFCLVDARGENRFKGLVDEPRKNLKKDM